MRKDRNLIVFIGHWDWYDRIEGIGYVPTDKAPEEAKKAMERYNSYAFPKKEIEKVYA